MAERRRVLSAMFVRTSAYGKISLPALLFCPIRRQASELPAINLEDRIGVSAQRMYFMPAYQLRPRKGPDLLIAIQYRAEGFPRFIVRLP